MSDFKRGDHVFNHGLKQSLQELTAQVREVLQEEPKLKALHGAGERSGRLNRLLTTIQRGLSQPAFALTVDKPGGKAPGGDANSQAFGRAKQQMVLAFRQFLQSLRSWELAKADDMDRRSRMLKTACLELRLTISKLAETAVDLEAVKAVQKVDPKSAGLVREGQAYLTKLRDEFIELLKWYQP